MAKEETPFQRQREGGTECLPGEVALPVVLLAAEARWPAVALRFPSLSLLFFFIFFPAASSSSSLPSLFSSLLSLFFPLLSRFLFFIGKNRGGGVVVGRPLSAAPPLTNQRIKSRRQVGEMRASYCTKSGKESRRKEKKKNKFSPLFSTRAGKKMMVSFQNGTVLRFPFFFFPSA